MLYRYIGFRFGQCNIANRTQERVFQVGKNRHWRLTLTILLFSGFVIPHLYSESPTVARMTSSGVVKPAKTFRMPSSRSVRMPISLARERNTEVGTFS